MFKILESLIAHRPATLAVQQGRSFCPTAATSEDSQRDLLNKHLSGELRVGAYTTIPGASLVRWCCFDLDGGGHSDANALEDPDRVCDDLEESMLRAGIPVIRERSGGGAGWHLWVIFDELQEARDVRDWMRSLLKGLSARTRAGRDLDPDAPKGIELFPKQDRVGDGEHGNLVWLPGWGQAPDPHLYHKGKKIVQDWLPVYRLEHKAPAREVSTASSNTGGVREKDVRAWLGVLDPDDYDTWLRVGMALNSWTKNGGGDGFLAWMVWSKGSDKFDANKLEEKWDSFRRDDGGVTIATLRYMAKEAGWSAIKRGSQVELAEHLLDGEVYDGADMYLYDDKTGIWDVVSAYDFERRVCALDGLEIPPKDEKSKPKVLNVSADMIRGVAQVATRVAPLIDDRVWTSSIGFACSNGWVTPRGIEPLRREHYARHLINVAFDPDARCPRWRQFLLESVDEESALVLQEFIGAALFGEATTFQKACVLWGDGGNGKSVFAQIVSLLFDRKDLCSYTPHSLDDNGTKADLRLRKFNIVMELPERELLDTSSIKSVFTGDPMSARRPYDVVPITFQPKCAHLFCCNVLPDTRNTDKGFWRRWLTIEFNRTPPKVDPYLKDKLAGELAGIVAWAVEGYNRLRDQGTYTRATSSDELRERWSESTNPVKSFVSQAVEIDEDAATPSSKLYETYLDWCSKTGRTKPLSAPKFGAEVKKHLQQGRNSNGSYYKARMRPASAWEIMG